MAAAIHLKNTLNQQIYHQRLTTVQEVTSYLHLIIICLVEQTSELRLQEQLSQSVEILLSYFQLLDMKSYAECSNFFEQIVTGIGAQIFASEPCRLRSMLIVLRVILESLKIEAMFNKVFPLMETYTHNLMIMLIPSEQDVEATVSSKLDFIQFWLESFQAVLERYEARKSFGYICLVQSAKYSSMLKKIITFGAFPTILLSSSGFKAIDRKLLAAKTLAFQCLTSLSYFILKVVSDHTKRQ